VLAPATQSWASFVLLVDMEYKQRKIKTLPAKAKFDRIILEIQKALQGSQRSLGRAI